MNEVNGSIFSNFSANIPTHAYLIMSESRQTIQLFIASSGDLATEREKMVLLLSRINKQFPHLYLEPVK